MNDLIGKILIDTDNKECKVLEVTSTSVNVWIEKKTKKGISYANWFYVDKEFWKRFKIKT